MAQGEIDSTQQIQTLITPELHKIKKSDFAPQEPQFFDKKSKLLVIKFATMFFN